MMDLSLTLCGNDTDFWNEIVMRRQEVFYKRSLSLGLFILCLTVATRFNVRPNCSGPQS